MKRALICGVSGQDGGYLAELLLKKGYDVWGTSRDAAVADFANLKALGIWEKVHLLSMAQGDFRSVLSTISKSEPDEIYFLSGQSSVGLSFEQPAETIESIVFGVLNLLEAVRFLGLKTRIYHASSSECFGDIAVSERADEQTPFRPRSPYGVAKSSAHLLISNYREAYGMHCSNGILFNHESPLRPDRFVTRKVVSTACRIASGSKERLTLGRLDIARDWGWAPDFVDAMWRMLQQEEPSDFVIASGDINSLENFVALAFAEVGLDWKAHVDIDETFLRPSEISYSAGNATKAFQELGWRTHVTFQQLISNLIKAEQSSLQP